MSGNRIPLLVSALLLACGDDADPSQGESEPQVDAAVYEGCPETTPPFSLGMRAPGESKKITGVLVDAMPDPPMRYRNDWTVGFQNASQEALADVQITEARPFMPVHGHDGNVKPMLTRHDDGSYLVAGLNLNMRGPWEIQLHVNSASQGSDYIVFHVCVSE